MPHLLATPAAHRWLSLEPLLGPADLSAYLGGAYVALPGDRVESSYNAGLNWIVVGCESGPHRRPMQLNWARSVRDQCQTAGVPFMLKQAEVAGRVVELPELDGRQWKEVPHA